MGRMKVITMQPEDLLDLAEVVLKAALQKRGAKVLRSTPCFALGLPKDDPFGHGLEMWLSVPGSTTPEELRAHLVYVGETFGWDVRVWKIEKAAESET